ncbi:MAG: hypothetical protein QOJ07_202 [Thermoleophilaceae bacterium]|nr:hypothetical protein [Thermoleophilaceae bacterium]
MKRVATLLLLAFGLPAIFVFGLGAGGQDSGPGYEVRGIFDNAAYVVKGEDVKVAGAVVGRVKSLDVTKDKRAAVVLEITKDGFAPFHNGTSANEGAKCTVRPQSLIGEKFVECTIGPDKGAALGKIPDGQPGAGQHLLKNTTSPVDLDLINDSLRLPYRQRLGLIINEFGTGLAGRGQALNQAIHRANPALGETDRVLGILADQNKTLANLAVDSDRVLGPLAGRRRRVSSFINNANKTAEATAERSADIERTFQRLPSYLNQLRPTLSDLGALSDQFTPVLANLETSAPDLNRFIGELGPFSRASTPALASLGKAADVGRPALERSRPLIRDLGAFGHEAQPVAKNLDLLTASLDKSGGIERAMDYLFFQMTAINGFDGISHYLRAGLITNLCQSYSISRGTGCSANFTDTKSIPPGSGSARLDPSLVKLRAALARYLGGGDGSTGTPAGSGASGGSPITAAEARRQLMDPRVAAQRNQGLAATRKGAGTDRSPYFDQHGQGGADTQLLDYLLGQDK